MGFLLANPNVNLETSSQIGFGVTTLPIHSFSIAAMPDYTLLPTWFG